MVLALLLMVGFVFPYVAGTLWANCAVRSKGHTEMQAHIERFQFLLYRYRPDVWWWGIVFNIRQTLLAFSPMVTPDDPSSQVIYVICVIIMYLALVSTFWPWKTIEVNLLDIASICVLAVMIVTVGSFIPESKWTMKHTVLLVISIVVIILGVATLLIYAAVNICKNGAKGDFGLKFLQGRPAKILASEWMSLCKGFLELDDESQFALVASMTNYDRRVLDHAISSIQAASEGLITVSDKAPARLVGVAHKDHSVRRLSSSKSSLNVNDTTNKPVTEEVSERVPEPAKTVFGAQDDATWKAPVPEVFSDDLFESAYEIPMKTPVRFPVGDKRVSRPTASVAMGA
eukprot:gnl/TRDRNA2_/TRDRNA2_145378_c1_seq1.p1 gnl/TRDRNA2_/TRDRNA2_145378_c1~~gnl/TRDRNA2_/TRDRNA2_145378_c1_seq1.p1  ORF type:complete len:372 (+),score=24.54 gnl/TRDRNA2_/TRDRNA2_145378_c1_seq1:87-1118(+)